MLTEICAPQRNCCKRKICAQSRKKVPIAYWFANINPFVQNAALEQGLIALNKKFL